MSSITVGVYLGKKDRIVRYWYEILPKGQFPMLVKYCMQSYLLRKKFFPLHTICDATSLREQMEMRSEYTPTQRNVTFTPDDGLVYKWVKELESGYRSEEIKTILRETVVHTLLTDKPVHANRGVSASPPPVYGVDPRGNQGIAAYPPPPGAAYAPEETAVPQHVSPNAEVITEDAYRAWDKLPNPPEDPPSGQDPATRGNPKSVSNLRGTPYMPMSSG